MVVFPCHFQIPRLCSSPDWWRHLQVVVLALLYLTSRSECRSTIKYEKSFYLVPNRIFSRARAKRYLDTSRIFHFDNFNFYALSLRFILKLSLLKHKSLTFRKLNLISLILNLSLSSNNYRYRSGKFAKCPVPKPNTLLPVSPFPNSIFSLFPKNNLKLFSRLIGSKFKHFCTRTTFLHLNRQSYTANQNIKFFARNFGDAIINLIHG